MGFTAFRRGVGRSALLLIVAGAVVPAVRFIPLEEVPSHSAASRLRDRYPLVVVPPCTVTIVLAMGLQVSLDLEVLLRV
jgi:hypothetical protein